MLTNEPKSDIIIHVHITFMVIFSLCTMKMKGVESQSLKKFAINRCLS